MGSITVEKDYKINRDIIKDIKVIKVPLKLNLILLKCHFKLNINFRVWVHDLHKHSLFQLGQAQEVLEDCIIQLLVDRLIILKRADTVCGANVLLVEIKVSPSFSIFIDNNRFGSLQPSQPLQRKPYGNIKKRGDDTT